VRVVSSTCGLARRGGTHRGAEFDVKRTQEFVIRRVGRTYARRPGHNVFSLRPYSRNRQQRDGHAPCARLFAQFFDELQILVQVFTL
jgi:hypothetical protein